MVRTSKFNLSINSIWFCLLVVYLVTGYFAQNALMPESVNSIMLYAFLGCSAFAILCERKIKFNVLIGWELACLALAIIAMLYSPSFSLFGGTFYAMLVNFLLVFIFSQMSWTKERFHLIMKTLVASSAGLILSLALTGNLNDSASGRLGDEMYGNANNLAMMLMVGAIYSIWLLMYTERKAGKLLSLIFLATTYFGMFLSGGRKYVVVPILFLYVMMMNKTDKKGRAHLIRNTLIVILVAVAVFLLIMKVPYFYEHIGNRFEGFFGLFDETKSADGSTLLRTKMAKAGLAKWTENPLFGYGFDSFKYYNASSVTGHLYYSHNNFVELLYNQGLIGFIAYYAFYVYLIVKAMKIRPRSLYKGFVIGTVISLLFFELFGITYSVTPIQFWLFFCFYCLNRGLKENPAK